MWLYLDLKTLREKMVPIFVTQLLGKLPQAPVLISKKQCHSTSFPMHTFSKNRFRHKAFCNIMSHIMIGRLLVASMIADTFIIGDGYQRYSLVANHHIRIISSTWPPCNQTSIAIIIGQCRNKLTHNLRISHRPQNIQIKFGSPKAIRIISIPRWLSIQKRNLAYLRFVARVINILTIYIRKCMPS